MQMQSLDILIEPLRALLIQVGSSMPRLVAAVAILLSGWLIAKAVRFGVAHALRRMNFHVLTERAGIDGVLKQGGVETEATSLLAALVYWFAILVTLMLACNSLGLDQASMLLHKVVLFMPRVFVALLVLIFGTYFACFSGNAVATYCESARVSDSELLGWLARYAMLLFVVLIAIDLLDIGGRLLQTTFLILFAGIVLALAIAFGLGGRDWAAALIERWWPRRPPPG